MNDTPMLHGKPLHLYVDGRGGYINRVRYQAQSALCGIVEDIYYVPTLEEAWDVNAWANRHNETLGRKR